MKKVKIYLRAIKDNDGKNQLSLFDSNRNGSIDNLTTIVSRGDIVIWKCDSKSGIVAITDIFPDEHVREKIIFAKRPRIHECKKTWRLQIPEDATGEEKYSIEYILCDGEKVTIDPTIKVRYP